MFVTAFLSVKQRLKSRLIIVLFLLGSRAHSSLGMSFTFPGFMGDFRGKGRLVTVLLELFRGTEALPQASDALVREIIPLMLGRQEVL